MTENDPDIVCDVLVHDKSQNLYRVAIFGKLSEDWLALWQQAYVNVDSMRDLCAYLANEVHKNPLAKNVAGFGQTAWASNNWRTYDIADIGGEHIAKCYIKLIDASKETNKHDYIETFEGIWDGFDHTHTEHKDN